MDDPLPPPSRRAWNLGRWVTVAALLFAGLGLLVQSWRLWSLTASYDQGIFLQVLWNSWHGHLFESSLSSQLSSSVLHLGALPDPTYRRLGQHFTPALMLWVPLLPLLGAWSLPVVQVGLMTAAGLVLHRLALGLLPAGPAAAIACSWYAALAVIGPTWCNFHDLCQLPLLVFALLLGWQERRWWLLLTAALLLPLVREDTGVVLFSIALWLGLRGGAPRWLALLLAVWGAGWTVLVTAVLMPAVSDDVSRRFMIENFGQYTGGAQEAGSLEVLVRLLGQPLRLLQELVTPVDQTVGYLLAQWLPLMGVPALSVDAWLLAGLPLSGLLLAKGHNDPLAITIRYALLVAPGFFAGAVFWWRRHGDLFARPRLRAVWRGCLILSLVLTIVSNPNRSLSFLVPDSLRPWVHLPLVEQARHGLAARRALAVIPPQASVSASTPLVPLLARRPQLLRFPGALAWRRADGLGQPVDWVAVDLRLPALRAAGFATDARQAKALPLWVQALEDQGWRRRASEDGVVVLQRPGP